MRWWRSGGGGPAPGVEAGATRARTDSCAPERGRDPAGEGGPGTAGTGTGGAALRRRTGAGAAVVRARKRRCCGADAWTGAVRAPSEEREPVGPRSHSRRSGGALVLRRGRALARNPPPPPWRVRGDLRYAPAPHPPARSCHTPNAPAFSPGSPLLLPWAVSPPTGPYGFVRRVRRQRTGCGIRRVRRRITPASASLLCLLLCCLAFLLSCFSAVLLLCCLASLLTALSLPCPDGVWGHAAARRSGAPRMWRGSGAVHPGGVGPPVTSYRRCVRGCGPPGRWPRTGRPPGRRADRPPGRCARVRSRWRVGCGWWATNRGPRRGSAA